MNTGFDNFGPFYVIRRRTTEKRWGFLNICLTTRAIHVEIITSMDASSCVKGVERFVSRRSTPSIVWSDNGTNSVGAEKELRKNIQKLNTINFAAKFAHKDVKWGFNQPSMPSKRVFDVLPSKFSLVFPTSL